MRLNTQSSGRLLRFIYLLCLFALAFDIIMLNIEGSWSSITKLSPFALLIILFLIYRGLPQFIYDSDGEVLNFTAREPNLKFLGKRFTEHTEFPKRKLLKYRISRWPFKRRLVLYIQSKEGGPKRVGISISYLTKSQLRDLKKSLDRVVATNRE
jgi:hypothetical protein